MSLSKKLPSEVRVGRHLVGAKHPTFFIAEIGNNHNGDYFIAKRLIEESIAAGANAVKLQKRFMDEVFTKELLDAPQTKDNILGKTYGEYRRALELNKEEFAKLKAHAESLGAVFFATPFDKKSVDFLEDLAVEVYKIASFDVTNLPLLEYVAKKKKPMFLSTGMCTMEELDRAVQAVIEHNDQLIILHCVSVYPTPDEKLNLRAVQLLQQRFSPLPVGYSGHERDILPSMSAVVLGARAVERHITLDKRMPGPDHATVSITPSEFKDMVDGTRRLEKGLGSPEKTYFPEEAKTREKHGKSVVTRGSIAKGTVLRESDLTCKSPGTGLAPHLLPSLAGKRARRDIPADHTLRLEDLEG